MNVPTCIQFPIRMNVVVSSVITVAAMLAVPAAAQSLSITPTDIAAAHQDDDVVQLEPFIVYGRHDPLFEAERRIQELGKHLPELNEGPRSNFARELLTALGLAGEGIQGEHAADQQRSANFLERLQSLD